VVAVVIAWSLLRRGHDAASDGATPGATPAGATTRSPASSGTSAAAGAGTAGNPTERPVSVLVTAVRREDVPIFLEGIGSVTALKTVTVKTQVDGRLDRVDFREGQNVRAGALLAQIDPRPFTILRHQAEAALARDRATLQSNRLNLERYVAVRKENLIAQQQVDDQRATVAQLEAAIQADQAQLEQAKLQLDYAHIRSPIDGVTGVRLVDPGNVVHAADPGGLVVVAQIDPVAVLFTLPQDDLPRIAAEMAKGPLRVDVSSRDGGALLGSGNLELIDNQINQTTASIRLKAILPNPGRTLWPNQFVKARLLLSVRKQALVVPAATIQRGPQGAFVYLVGQDQKANIRPVEVDSLEGDTAVIGRGLAAGDSVVIEGQTQLRPGARVAAKSQDRGSEHAAAPGPDHPARGGGAPERRTGGGPGGRPGGGPAGSAASGSPPPPRAAPTSAP
jgi:multidrug efflux system membrane fusion protein